MPAAAPVGHCGGVEAEYERRTKARRIGAIAVHVRALGRSSRPSVVHDISEAGCCVEPGGFLIVGSVVWIRFPALESWQSKVVWVADDRAGLAFTRNLHPAVADRLVALLR